MHYILMVKGKMNNMNDCNDDDTFVRVVSPSGSIYNGSYDYGSGVRPVCIFSSSIFESCEEDDD